MGFSEVSLVADYVTVIKPGPKLLLTMLADRAQRFPELGGRAKAWPSVDELAHRTCQSRRTVFRQLAELEELGLITVSKRRQIDSGGHTRQASNMYVLDLPAMQTGRFLRSTHDDRSGAVSSQDDTVSPGQSASENAWSGSGCQNDTLTPEVEENAWSGSGCQNDTLKLSGCQMGGGQGDTGVTLKIKKYKYPSPSPSQPVDDGACAASGLDAPGGAGVGLADGASAGRGDDFENSSGVVAAVAPAAPQPEPVGRVPEPADAQGVSQSSAGSVPSAFAVAFECLPEPMASALTPAVALSLVEPLQRRLDAGIKPERIKAILASRALPGQVRNMGGLIRKRLDTDVPLDLPSAPVSAGSEPSLSPSQQRVWREVSQEFRYLVCDVKAGSVTRDEGARQLAELQERLSAAGVATQLQLVA